MGSKGPQRHFKSILGVSVRFQRVSGAFKGEVLRAFKGVSRGLGRDSVDLVDVQGGIWVDSGGQRGLRVVS